MHYKKYWLGSSLEIYLYYISWRPFGQADVFNIHEDERDGLGQEALIVIAPST